MSKLKYQCGQNHDTMKIVEYDIQTGPPKNNNGDVG